VAALQNRVIDWSGEERDAGVAIKVVWGRMVVGIGVKVRLG
jgi:hypothetical protein